MVTFPTGATLAQLVEHHAENVGVRSSILRGRTISIPLELHAGVAQLVEHVTRNDGVTGSIPVTSSIPGWAGPNPRPLASTPNRDAATPPGDAAAALKPEPFHR